MAATNEPAQVFYTLEILYLSVADGSNVNEVRRHVLKNLTRAKVWQMREDIFTHGFAIVIDSDTLEIVPPFRVSRVYQLRQAHFFKEYQLGELTNPNSRLSNRKY